MPYLTVFRNTFVRTLLSNIGSNLDKYRRNDKWVLELGSQSTRDLQTRIEVKLPLLLDEPDDDNLKDLENAIRIHKALSELTPLQARDPRLWTRLAHVDCWQYMRKRWPLERFGADSEKGARFIAARYFISQTDSRALMRNGVARLWWTAHMSYDAQRKNSYELTSVLLYTLDITQQIMERNMGRAPVIVTGFLEFLMQNKDKVLVVGDYGRDRIRRLAKFLNLYGGVCLLDCLTQTDIIKLLGDELGRILENEDKKKKEAKVQA
jgi:Family of unknown function (DUF6339)